MPGSVSDFEGVNPTFGYASIGRGQKSSAFTPVTANQTPTTYVIRGYHSNIIIIKVVLTRAIALARPAQLKVSVVGLLEFCLRCVYLGLRFRCGRFSAWNFSVCAMPYNATAVRE